MQKQKHEPITITLTKCPRCKTENIRAINVRDCYFDGPYCPNCGKVDITRTQEIIKHHNLFHERTELVGIKYEFRYADDIEIEEFKEIENEEDAHPVSKRV